jgi:hypothetical protein
MSSAVVECSFCRLVVSKAVAFPGGFVCFECAGRAVRMDNRRSGKCIMCRAPQDELVLVAGHVGICPDCLETVEVFFGMPKVARWRDPLRALEATIGRARVLAAEFQQHRDGPLGHKARAAYLSLLMAIDAAEAAGRFFAALPLYVVDLNAEVQWARDLLRAVISVARLAVDEP